MKRKSKVNFDAQPFNASHRITALFLDLLELQFPVDTNKTMKLHSPADFANHLNIHVNHLNRSIKKNLQKTTSQVIAERILQESKMLLMHSSLNVSEIAYVLGFSESTRFNNFFKKHMKTNPMKFRTNNFLSSR